MNTPTRSYTNGEVTVDWRPELCVHCRRCITGLPEVFDDGRRPWIDLQGIDTVKIRDQVAECPSGALSILEQP